MNQLKRRFEKLLRDCLEEAVARGAKDPQIYVESESGLCVLDGVAHEGIQGHAQPDRMLFSLPWPAWLKGHVDVGSW